MRPSIASGRATARAGRAACCAALLSAALPAIHAADAPQDLRADVVARGTDYFVEGTKSWLGLSDTLPIDADARRRIDALTSGFAERQRPVFERWTRELANTPEGRRDPLRVTDNVGARLLVALANWRLRSGGAAHEALLRQAAAKPGDCRVVDNASTAMDEVAALLQVTPVTQRDAFMEGERQLLAHWDAATPVLEANAEDPARDVAHWMSEIRRGGPPATLPMATRLAGMAFADPPMQVTHPGRCAARQWWLANRLKQAPGASEAIWQAWHLAFASDLVLETIETPATLDQSGLGYPDAVRRLGLEGKVQVRVEKDARGHFASGSVTERHLVSHSLPEGMPIPMFDRLLDGPSLARARKLTNEQAAAAAPGASAATAGSTAFQFKWALE